jgi:hypothetical protein
MEKAKVGKTRHRWLDVEYFFNLACADKLDSDTSLEAAGNAA